MKPGPPFHSRLGFRLGAGFLLLGLLVGALLVVGALVPLERFAREQVEGQMRELARDLYGVCDEAYTRQLRSGAEAGSPEARAARARAMALLEDRLRREGAEGLLRTAAERTALTATAPPEADALTAALSPGAVGEVRVKDRRYYATAVSFAPWGWEIVVLRDAAAYEGVLERVRSMVAATAAAFVMLGLLLLAFVDRQVRGPLQRIVAAVRRGEEPPREQVAEFDFLAEELRRHRAETAAREAALRSRKAQLATVIENLPFDFFALDREGRYFLQNSRSRERWGDVVGRRVEDLGHDAALLERWLANNRRALAGESVEAESTVVEGGEVRHRSDLVVPIRVDGRIEGILGFSGDVTERRRLEEDRSRLNRLESLGVLAGGIAHDFNNLLAAILGNVNLARLQTADPAASELLFQAERACQRAEGLTRQLLTFSRGGAPVSRPVQLGQLLSDTVEMAVRGSRVEAALELAPDLPVVEGDEGQLAQAFGNLVLNAVQSMPAGGRVRVAAAGLPPAPGGGAPAGRRVRVEVGDSGVGIPPEALPRIFDPYFTTKAQGSGLGLAITFSIVRNHGGRIEVTSAPGCGTTFRVDLPAGEGAGAATARAVAPAAPLAGRVLVMDDEEPVRAVLLKMLGKLGLQADGAATGEEAIGRFRRAREEGAPYDAVILDLIVRGGMGGRETLARLKAEDPAVRAIVVSGYSADDALANHAKHGFRGMLAKPFESSALERTLRAVLGGAPPA